MDVLNWQWVILIAVNIVLFWVSPWSNKVNDFFKGSKNDEQPNTFLLTSSLVITWLFAKSITNAADLGYKFGIVGGVAYAGYYVSFLVAGILIYQMRTKGGFKSIHHFLQQKYGQGAIVLFTILIGFRLLNEIWSNTMIVGSYFGEKGSMGYFSAIIVFTALTLAYTLKGGMRTSIITDLIQMAMFAVLMVMILGIIIPNTEGGMTTIVSSGEWTMSQGLNLFFVALIQVLSYPFHDPILTDRGFISEPKTTLKSYVLATFIGGACIILFSSVGTFAALKGLKTPPTLEVAKLMGTFMLLAMNTIMLTSAAATIDSTFTSTAKLVHLDLLKERNLSVSKARWTMTAVAVFGTLPVLFNPEILSATTISGTMVLGLAPVFVFWNIKAPKISFYGSVLSGIFFGFLMVFYPIPERFLLTSGKYADLLVVNIVGTIVCFLFFLIPVLLVKSDKRIVKS
ncbi:MAG: sodium:solute symporter [Saprospiraceae bacterium]|nr:sodium:solute symporter [Saprospiraceae bacterium]